MTVVFDAEPLLAFAFDEPGASEVEDWLGRVYDAEIEGYVTTLNLAEFRYVATRAASREMADTHIGDLQEMGVAEYDVDDLWRRASDVKAAYSPAIGDAYAVAAAEELDDRVERDVALLVGADDDYEVLEGTAEFGHLIERFRDGPA